MSRKAKASYSAEQVKSAFKVSASFVIPHVRGQRDSYSVDVYIFAKKRELAVFGDFLTWTRALITSSTSSSTQRIPRTKPYPSRKTINLTSLSFTCAIPLSRFIFGRCWRDLVTESIKYAFQREGSAQFSRLHFGFSCRRTLPRIKPVECPRHICPFFVLNPIYRARYVVFDRLKQRSLRRDYRFRITCGKNVLL